MFNYFQNMFVLDPTTGQLTLNSTLNRDVITSWRAVVTAVDTTNSKTGTGKADSHSVLKHPIYVV
jgi:hypothetical protein